MLLLLLILQQALVQHSQPAPSAAVATALLLADGPDFVASPVIAAYCRVLYCLHLHLACALRVSHCVLSGVPLYIYRQQL